MDTEGYLILPQFHNPNPIKDAINPYKQKTKNFFYDAQRKQIRLPVYLLEDLRKKLLTIPLIQNKSPCNYFVLVQSLQGCVRQEPSVDSMPEFTLTHKDDILQASQCIFAIEDNTKLIVWPGSHKVLQGRGRTIPPIHPQVITLSAGDVLILRADIVYAFSEYDTENTSIHCYLDSIPRHRDRGWIIGKHTDILIRQKILDV